jgi:hypothetical protein
MLLLAATYTKQHPPATHGKQSSGELHVDNTARVC